MKKNAPGSYSVVDDVLHYTTKAGHELELDFDFPAEVLKQSLEGNRTEDQQFDTVASVFGADAKKAYEAMGALERTRFVKTFFREWQKAAGLPLGESLSSSTS